MKVDIHGLEQALLDRATETGAVVEILVNGTGKDGSPACATVKLVRTGLA
jgi:hypothetical protein